MNDENIRNAILKVALGFSVEEVTEEYGVEDGELKLVKRKETRKDIPPDLKAARLLLDDSDVSALSDEELEREKAELLEKLAAALKKQNGDTMSEKEAQKTGKTPIGYKSAGKKK